MALSPFCFASVRGVYPNSFSASGSAPYRSKSSATFTCCAETAQYNGLVLNNAFRPDVNLALPIWIPDPNAPGGRRLNAAAFAVAPGLRQGNLGRNSISGFGMSQVDLAARRRFRLTERGSLELRLEVFNALNHPNFGDPVKYLNSPLFGQSTSMLNLMLGSGSPGSGLAPLLQSGGSRSMQVCLRFAF